MAPKAGPPTSMPFQHYQSFAPIPLPDRTWPSRGGARGAVVHLNNAPPPPQRGVVSGLARAGIVDMAVRAARLCRDLTKTLPECDVHYQYSPESFTGTELDFAVEICEAV